jgi:cytochrome c553
MWQLKSRNFVTLAIISASATWGALAANGQTKPEAANAETGRAFALLACTGCHIVAQDQLFEPIYKGLPYPPAFKQIANRPNITTASLQHYLETLPTVPEDVHTPDLFLSADEIREIVAFIISLRDKPSAPSQ